MAKDKVILCAYYCSAGVCALGKKECHIWREMQTCPSYKKKPHSIPIRKDNRKQKLDRARRKDRD